MDLLYKTVCLTRKVYYHVWRIISKPGSCSYLPFYTNPVESIYNKKNVCT